MPTIKIKSFWTAVAVAVVFSLVNFFLGWLLYLLALPFIIITFGLFSVVVNAVMLMITDKLIDGFEIKGFLSTVIAAIFIAVINSGLHRLL